MDEQENQELEGLECPFCGKPTKTTSLLYTNVCFNHNLFVTFCYNPPNPEPQYIYLGKNGMETEFSNEKAKLYKYDDCRPDDEQMKEFKYDKYTYDGDADTIMEIDFSPDNKTYENYEKMFYRLSKMMAFL